MPSSQKRKKSKLLRFVTTKRNAGRYSERIVPIGNKNVVDPTTAAVAGGEEQEEPQSVFVDNEISTSKYSIYSFLFK